MKPTIGRIVHFIAHEDCGSETYAAIVTKVHSETVVDLATLGTQSLYFQTGVANKHAAAPDNR